MLATSRVKRGRHRFRLERRLIAVTSVVWLKRDLRVADHRPLTAAAARGRVVVLFVYEPELIAEQTTDPSHYTFIDECLIELEAALGARGGALTYRYGPMPDVLATLSDELGGFDALYAHEETGSAVSYARDKRVRAWCAARGIACYEIPQFGVIRPLRTRDGWARRWDARMTEPLVAAPSRIETPALAHGARRTLRDIGLPERHKPEAKRGGESRALAELESFLATRGVNYRQDMSSPVAGWSGCSRLSPYIAFGAISLRTVYRATLARAANVRERRLAGEPLDARWTGSLSSFRGRLHWHCHFMQKLEDQPSLEFVNATRAFDGMREDDFDETRFAAWCAGRTGYPMVDACMRALHAGGWINFRMRAMLMSFASYHLWLHWRRTGIYLATQFLDFEPGIHWPQSQMQSGVTGINAIRIYSPAKQARDNDPTGVFIRRYVPELANVPDAYLAEPHLLPPLVAAAAGFVAGVDYPMPIVDEKLAVARAKENVYAVRRRSATRTEAQSVYRKHGSRKPVAPRRGPT
jgi:deoxyribodipyrimidine photo-lyase